MNMGAGRVGVYNDSPEVRSCGRGNISDCGSVLFAGILYLFSVAMSIRQRTMPDESTAVV